LERQAAKVPAREIKIMIAKSFTRKNSNQESIQVKLASFDGSGK